VPSGVLKTTGDDSDDGIGSESSGEGLRGIDGLIKFRGLRPLLKTAMVAK
jgi:hypothetical protein